MAPRRRTALAAICAIALLGLVVPTSSARATAVAKVYGLSGAGVYLSSAKLGVKWKKVTGASYQVRWASSTGTLSKAKVYPTTKTSAISPTLSNVCLTWYAQVRAKKSGRFGAWSTPRSLTFGIKPPTSVDIAAAKFTGAGVANGVKFTWNAVPKATQYQVEWDAAPFGKFSTARELIGSTWTTQRTVTLGVGTVPTAGDRMMGSAYGNPVYAKLIANNKCYPKNLPSTPWVPVFPAAPSPGAGDALRVGTYNLELTPANSKVAQDGPARIAAFADNVAAHDLDLLILQEANAATVTDLIAGLATSGEGDWSAVAPAANSQQQILYRSTKYSVVGAGTFGQAPPHDASVPLVTPWVRLHPLVPDDGNVRRDVFVVAPHLAQDFDGILDGDPDKKLDPVEQRENKRRAGIASTVLLTAIEAENTDDLPVISAGDYKYLREPFQDVDGQVEGPPTFVRGLAPGEGFYDAINSHLAPVGAQYTTVNGHAAQTPHVYGVASRADYILLKGFQGSVKYVNVANRSYPSVNWNPTGDPKKSVNYPSDHNLIYADVVVPFG